MCWQPQADRTKDQATRSQLILLPAYLSKRPNVNRRNCAIRLWLVLAPISSLVSRATMSGARRLTVAYQAATFLEHDHLESAACRKFLGHGEAAPPSTDNGHIHGVRFVMFLAFVRRVKQIHSFGSTAPRNRRTDRLSRCCSRPSPSACRHSRRRDNCRRFCRQGSYSQTCSATPRRP